jgi:iron complex transport system substrate-binding protein
LRNYVSTTAGFKKPIATMRALLVVSFLVLALDAMAPVRAAPMDVRDDRGQTVRIDAPVSRIVTLAPHLTELVYAAGAGSKLVGVSANSDYPPPARNLPVVGGAGRVDLERVVSLKPDLVLAWLSGGERTDVERLEHLGIPVIVTEPRHLEDIARVIELIGRVAATSYEATRAAHQFREDLRLLKTRYGDRRTVSVFYQIWHNPLMTINGEHIISEAIGVCGGRNIFADLPTLVPTVSMEALLVANPDAIIVSGSPASKEALLAEWSGHAGLRAVRAGHVYFLDADLAHRATPRMLEGVRTMCEDLQKVREAERH